MSIVTKNVALYVKEKGINISKMARDTKVSYAALYTSLCDEERERALRADELLAVCDFLEIEPRYFRQEKEVV